MNKWLRIVAVFVALAGFIWMMVFSVGQSSREHLAKINQQLTVLESSSPEEYYKRTKQDLLKRKEIKEGVVKLYDEKGTHGVIYGAVLETPQVIKALWGLHYR